MTDKIDETLLNRYCCRKCDGHYFHITAGENQLFCATKTCAGVIFEAVYRFGGTWCRCPNCCVCRQGQELIKAAAIKRKPMVLRCTHCGTTRNWQDIRKGKNNERDSRPSS